MAAQQQEEGPKSVNPFSFEPTHVEVARIMESEIDARITELEEMWFEDNISAVADHQRLLEKTTTMLITMDDKVKVLARFRQNHQLLCRQYVSRVSPSSPFCWRSQFSFCLESRLDQRSMPLLTCESPTGTEDEIRPKNDPRRDEDKEQEEIRGRRRFDGLTLERICEATFDDSAGPVPWVCSCQRKYDRDRHGLNEECFKVQC